MSRCYELEDYVCSIDEYDEENERERQLQMEYELEVNTCSGNCGGCMNCVEKPAYNGRTNLVCRLTGEVIFEE